MKVGHIDIKRRVLILRDRLDNVRYAIKILLCASKKYFILYWLLSIGMAFVPFVPLYLWKQLLNSLADFQNSGTKKLFFAIIISAAVYFVFMFVEKLLGTVQNIVSYKYNDEIDFYIDNLLIDTTTKADLAFFDSSTLRDKMNHVAGFIGGVTKNIPTFLFETIQMLVWNIVSLVIVSKINVFFPLVIILLEIPSIIGRKRMNKYRYEFNKKHTKNRRKLAYYQGLFQGTTLFEMKLYDLKQYFSTLYKDLWAILRKDTLKYSIKNCMINCLSVILSMLGDIIIYIVTISRLVTHILGIGDITYYISILGEFRWRFSGLFGDFNGLLEFCDEFMDIRELLEQKSDVEQSGSLIPDKKPVIEFKNVSFQYPNSEIYVLHHCNFVIEPGETFGLVGLNGSGKSTIVKLLCRFYDPTEGEILINGIDARNYDIIKLRALFGVLFQNYVRYSLSLRENIALSDISKRDNEKEILLACQKSRVSDFIKDWDKGIDENMTRQFDVNGKEVSGGQWQRISLARAFFRDAPVVLLDEPSAALDPIAEYEIFENFKHISKDKSAVLISHRLSSITLCNKILVLENGRIVEQGSHSELIKKQGKYAYLFGLQASKYQ